MRLLSSQVGSGPLVMASLSARERMAPPSLVRMLTPLISDVRVNSPDGPRLLEAGNGQVLFPRFVDGRTVMVPIHPEQMPPGWQSVTARMAMAPASCDEVDCPNLAHGWTQVVLPDGRTDYLEGVVTQDEAIGRFGYFGPDSAVPAVFPQPPGTPCPRVHKKPAGTPPLYMKNGRWVLFNEFEDALGGGVHRMREIRKQGAYY